MRPHHSPASQDPYPTRASLVPHLFPPHLGAPSSLDTRLQRPATQKAPPSLSSSSPAAVRQVNTHRHSFLHPPVQRFQNALQRLSGFQAGPPPQCISPPSPQEVGGRAPAWTAGSTPKGEACTGDGPSQCSPTGRDQENRRDCPRYCNKMVHSFQPGTPFWHSATRRVR